MKAFVFKHIYDQFECGVSVSNVFILDIDNKACKKLQNKIETRLESNNDIQLQVLDFDPQESTLDQLEDYVKQLENEESEESEED